MMTEPVLAEDQFQKLLDSLYDNLQGDDPLRKMRTKAWEHFLELGLPTRKTEVFQYIPLRKLFSKQYGQPVQSDVSPEALEPYIHVESQEALLVLVNGSFAPHLSRISGLPKKVAISSLRQATTTFGTFLNNHWAKVLKEETDPFAVINTALHRDGLFIYLPPKTLVDKPIQILNVITTESAGFLMPRVQVFVGAQSQVEFISSYAIPGATDACVNQYVDFAIEDDARVRYHQSQCAIPASMWLLDATRALLKRNSSFDTLSVSEGSQTQRNDYRIALTGENGEALLHGVWMLNEQREAHTHIVIDHQAPYCNSRQLYKGALDDVSRSSFEGKILVRQAAQKTDAFQLNNNLLLSERALAYSKPNLEIFADDVKASHGATFGQLDQDELFMLKSRGIPTLEAKNLLIGGYCKEVIDRVKVPSLLEHYNKRVQQYREG